MKYVKFIWNTKHGLEMSVKKTVESAINEQFIDQKIDLSHRCHPEMVTAHLGAMESDDTNVVGCLTCNCGRKFCDFSTENNGHHMNFISYPISG